MAIGRDAKNVSVEDATNYIFGYAVGLDMTRRDLQMSMREKGRPWKLVKHLISLFDWPHSSDGRQG